METHSTAHLRYKPAIMGKIKQITIPQPCHQSWRQMEIKENGRNCLHCAKTVVDFTKMTNNEILTCLSGTRHVCGRFNPNQLGGINYQLKTETQATAFNWRSWIIAAGLFSAGIVSKGRAQIVPEITAAMEHAPADSSRKNVALADSAGAKPITYRVSGVVIGSDDKLPVVGASVYIKGTKVGAVTDLDGCFDLPVQKSKAVLVVSYIGYEEKEVKVSFAKNTDLNVTLKINPAVMGELDITPGRPLSRVAMFYQYMPWPVNRLFK